MAVFTVGKKKISKDSRATITTKYETEQDLINLMHYCCDKSRYTVFYNLYPLGTDCFADQMLYLQKFRGKKLSTRAIHYIIGLTKEEMFEKNKLWEAEKIVAIVGTWYFQDYQSVTCLHTDKPGRYDIHIIINPVNVKNYNLYHCSQNDFMNLLKTVAADLYMMYQIAFVGVSYIREDGRMVYGNSPDLYMNKAHWVDGEWTNE